MTHCKYYFEILFYVTFVFIKEKKKSVNNKKNVSIFKKKIGSLQNVEHSCSIPEIAILRREKL